MNIIEKLNTDLIIKILDLYYIKYIKCIENNTRIKKLFINKYIYSLYKNELFKQAKCTLFNIKEINYNICIHHNNIELYTIKNIIKQIINIKNNNAPIIYNNKNENINIINKNSIGHIHNNNLKKNIIIIEKILYKYGYKILHFCCNNTGCKIIKL